MNTTTIGWLRQNEHSHDWLMEIRWIQRQLVDGDMMNTNKIGRKRQDEYNHDCDYTGKKTTGGMNSVSFGRLEDLSYVRKSQFFKSNVYSFCKNLFWKSQNHQIKLFFYSPNIETLRKLKCMTDLWCVMWVSQSLHLQNRSFCVLSFEKEKILNSVYSYTTLKTW